MLVLFLLTARVLTRLLVLPADGDGTKALEILVLRHQLQVLRRKPAAPGSPRSTGSCSPVGRRISDSHRDQGLRSIRRSVHTLVESPRAHLPAGCYRALMTPQRRGERRCVHAAREYSYGRHRADRIRHPPTRSDRRGSTTTLRIVRPTAPRPRGRNWLRPGRCALVDVAHARGFPGPPLSRDR
jgi:hypothetical protein